MFEKIHRYPILVKEVDLDLYAHVNNATYLKMLEEARWDFIQQNGYGYHKIAETGYGPIILETTIRYIQELRLRDEILIETKFLSYEKKIGKMQQTMSRGDQLCCTADFTIALFDLKARKLVLPTKEWLTAIGFAT